MNKLQKLKQQAEAIQKKIETIEREGEHVSIRFLVPAWVRDALHKEAGLRGCRIHRLCADAMVDLAKKLSAERENLSLVPENQHREEEWVTIAELLEANPTAGHCAFWEPLVRDAEQNGIHPVRRYFGAKRFRWNIPRHEAKQLLEPIGYIVP